MMLLTRIIKRLYKATGYSWSGLKAAWVNEEAFRFELVLFLLLAPVAFWLAQSALQFALLLGVGLLVLVAELLNSAVEAIVDQVTREHTELAGRAKDMGSAAVFVSFGVAALVWLAVIYDRWCG